MGDRGVSTVEYVLILLVVGISCILVVRNYGTEIKRLWGSAGEPLGLLDGVFEDETGGITGPVTGDFETIEEPAEPEDPGPGDENDDCEERLAAMQVEYEEEMVRLTVELTAAQTAYDAAMETRRSYRRSGGRWGGGGHWTMEYVHPASVRQAAQDRLDSARAGRDAFQADWQARHDQLQSECGGN